MPGGDGTGPRGMGPMTGRAAGYCAGYQVPGSANFPSGRRSGMAFGLGGGFGAGFNGRGRGFRNQFYTTGQPGWMRGRGFSPYVDPYMTMPVNRQVNKDDEIQLLKEQAEYFKKAADNISARLSELEKEEA